MAARLTLTEKEALVQEERRRRVVARKQQVRAQADEYSRQVRLKIRRKSLTIAASIKNEVRIKVSSRLSNNDSPRPPNATRNTPRSVTSTMRTPKRVNHALKQAVRRGAQALQLLRKARRSEEVRKQAILNRKNAAKQHFNKVSKQGAEKVPMMQQ